MKLRIHRTERIAFDAPVREHHLEWRCAPWDDAGQRLHRLELSTLPETTLASHRDCFGNQVHRMALLAPHKELTLSMLAEVETLLADPTRLEPMDPAREQAWIDASLKQAPRLWDFLLHQDEASRRLQALAQGAPADDLGIHTRLAAELPCRREGISIFDQVRELTRCIAEHCELLPEPAAGADPQAQTEAQDAPERTTDNPPAAITPTAAAALRRAAGTPTELALLLLAIARHWGLPARLASGYLFAHTDLAASTAQPTASALHHWAEVLIPGGDWRGFDPARGEPANDTYVRVAVGRDDGDLRWLKQSCKGDGQPLPVVTELRIESLG